MSPLRPRKYEMTLFFVIIVLQEVWFLLGSGARVQISINAKRCVHHSLVSESGTDSKPSVDFQEKSRHVATRTCWSSDLLLTEFQILETTGRLSLQKRRQVMTMKSKKRLKLCKATKSPDKDTTYWHIQFHPYNQFSIGLQTYCSLWCSPQRPHLTQAWPWNQNFITTTMRLLQHSTVEQFCTSWRLP